MKSNVICLLAIVAGVCALAQNSVDAYMGDWKGTLRLADGQDQVVAVNLIPDGNGNYEAKVMTTFEKRVPTLFQLRGRFQAGEFLQDHGNPVRNIWIEKLN